MKQCGRCQHDKREHAPGLGCVWEDADGWLCMCRAWVDQAES